MVNLTPCIKIYFHSFIDIITNSSTEMFVKVNEKCIEATKEIVNKILIAGGCGKSFDDLYTIRLVGPERDKDEFEYRKEEDLKRFIENLLAEDDDLTKNQAKEKAMVMVEEKYKGVNADRHDIRDSEASGNDCIIIEPKDGSQATIDLISDLSFEIFEVSC